MSKILSIDSPLWAILNKMTDTIVLSLLFIVTSIPIVTMGSSLCALYYMMFRIADNTEGHVVRGYFKAFKENFKKSTPVWLLCLFTGLVLAGDIFICVKAQVPMAGFILAAAGVLTILYMMLVLYLFPLLAKCTGDIRQLAFMAFMMSIKEWWRTIFMLFITFIMFAVGVFVTAPFLIVAPGVIALSHVYIFRTIFAKYGMKEEERTCQNSL